MTPATSGPEQPAFETFAPYYDDYTHLYQAASWTGKLVALAENHGVDGKRLLDVGCGTGKSFLPMLERGWTAVGTDVSPAMLAVAREKIGDGVELHEADVRELPSFGEFDLVWALNDTLNNLLGAEELEAALRGMKGNLAVGGVVLFDLNTESLCRAVATEEEAREVDGRRMKWTGLAESFGPGDLVESRFEVAGDPAATEVHRQRHFPQAQVLGAVARAGLEAVGVWGDYEGEQDQPLDEERHQKAIYVAR